MGNITFFRVRSLAKPAAVLAIAAALLLSLNSCGVLAEEPDQSISTAAAPETVTPRGCFIECVRVRSLTRV
ncbi:hypothetical protein [Paenarthrobacter ureafaciens]|uniref:hypothetical protein n=1 Tax=Paenarthrobacter ureafaciens TaxID=37931 RepID=UPI00346439BF